MMPVAAFFDSVEASSGTATAMEVAARPRRVARIEHCILARLVPRIEVDR